MKQDELDKIWDTFATARTVSGLSSLNEPASLSSVSKRDCDCTCLPSTASKVVEGFLICSGCGIAKDVHIDTGAEWRTFASNDSGGGGQLKSSSVRCGEPANALMPGTQLNTYIGRGGSTRQQRVHQWHNLSSRERGLHQIYVEYQQIAATFSIHSNVILAATDFFRRLQSEMDDRNNGVKRCNVRQGLKAACLYYACKKLNTPRERRDIADMLDTTTKIVTRGCNTFLDVMGDEFIHMPPMKPHDFLGRFCQLLGLGYSDELQVGKVIHAALTLGVLVDSTPTSVASGCIYFYSTERGYGLTKATIRDKCGSSQAIVAKIYTKLCENRQKISNFDAKLVPAEGDTLNSMDNE